MASLLSVNVGIPTDVAWEGRTVHTGIWKSPVPGPRMARRLNLDGDGQGDTAGHGGENRAVLVYQLDSYDHWRTYLGRDDLEPGHFGENLTVDGLADTEVCIGDRYRIGQRRVRGHPTAGDLLPASGCASAARTCPSCSSPTTGPASTCASSPKAGCRRATRS